MVHRGYRANVVTYGLAKIVHDADLRKKVIDLDKVWSLQRVPPNLERACIAAAEAANAVITSPPAGIQNMSEWAKKQACWADLAKRPVEYGSDFWDNLIDQADARPRNARRPRIGNSHRELKPRAKLSCRVPITGNSCSRLVSRSRS